MPARTTVSVPLLVSLFGVCGCAAAGLYNERGAGIPMKTSRFDAPAGLLRFSWRRSLSLGKEPLFQYRPQEFATATAGDDGMVYVGSSYQTFYALRERDGEVVWERPLTGSVSSQPLYLPAGAVLPKAMVVVGDDDGALNALDARTGEPLWPKPYRVHGTIQVQPTLAGGLIYFTSGEGRLYAVDARTGAWRWQYEREVPESFTVRGGSGALVVGGRVYAGFSDGYLGCLNATTGEVVWTRQLSGDAVRFTDVDSTPVLHDGNLYVSSYATGVFALDPKDGSTRWHFDLEQAGPLQVDDAGRIFVAAARQGLHCLDSHGRLQWRQSLAEQGELSPPVVWGPYLLFTAAGAGMYVVRGSTGELLQFYDPGQGASGKPAARGRMVYLLSNRAAFYALTDL